MDLYWYYYTVPWCGGPWESSILCYPPDTDADSPFDAATILMASRRRWQSSSHWSSGIPGHQVPVEGCFFWIPGWCVGVGADNEQSCGQKLHHVRHPVHSQTGKGCASKQGFHHCTTQRMLPDHQMAFGSTLQQGLCDDQTQRFDPSCQSRSWFDWSSWTLEGLGWVPAEQTWRAYTRPGHWSHLSAFLENKHSGIVRLVYFSKDFSHHWPFWS